MAITDRDGALEFAANIQATLAAHPEWLGAALHAVSTGMSDALRAANDYASKADLAMRTALFFAGPDRVTPASKEMFENALLTFLETRTKGSCLIEEKVLANLRKGKRP